MAELKTKKIIKISPERWTMQDEFNGRTFTVTEVGIQVEGPKGADSMVLRSRSEKLVNALKPGDEVHGYTFTDENNERYPKLWRISALAKNNTHLVGEHQGPQRPEKAPEPQGGYTSSPYTFEELVGLFRACHGASKDVQGDVSDDAVQAGAATLFIQATRMGLQGADVGGNVDDDPVLDAIYKAVDKGGLRKRLYDSEVLDAELKEMWEECSANEAAFVIALHKELEKEKDELPIDDNNDEPPF